MPSAIIRYSPHMHRCGQGVGGWGGAAYLDGDLVLGEGATAQQLVDAVDGQEALDVGAQVVGHRHTDSVSRHHLTYTRSERVRE